MDFQIPFIFVSVFSLASVVLIFIFKFGIKEKSYEEALAEQRQQTHILLGIKPRLKEKKNKKITKKSKDKPVTENENVESQETTEFISDENTLEGEKHVEFKETVEETSVKNVVISNKKQSKKERIRPILVNKENEVVNKPENEKQNVSNHFEEIHPKDDFELFRSVGGDEEVKEEVEVKSKTKAAKLESEPSKAISRKHVESSETPPPPQENPVLAPPTSTVNGIVSNTGKEKKKKKSEFNTLQQLAGDTTGLSFLLNVVRKAELTRSEVQILIDLLLNKQHEAPAILDEWSEGKSDPVQKLKKQLAEKEKLLAEEQQMVASTQAKLREIRSEHQADKNTLQQKLRALDELNHGKQLELTRFHQQLQQLQSQLNDEALKNHKLREEHNALQIQRQQFEIRVAQAQESEVIIGQLQNEAQELSSINNQLRMELARLSDENCAEKEHQQSFIVQLNNLKMELDQKNDRNQQLEEKRVEVERNLENILQQDNDLKAEISRLSNSLQQQNDELRKLEHIKKQYQDDLQKYKDESSTIINQLKTDVQALQEENSRIKSTQINGSLKENQQHEIEILNLRNELSSLKTQLNQAENKNESEARATRTIIDKLEIEIDELKKRLEEEKIKLSEQIVKNNELRTKNWKVMEALNAAESRIKTVPNIQSKDKDIQRDFVQRLFPEIKDLPDIEPDVYIKDYVDKLRKDSVKENSDSSEQLKSQLQHYKNVIDNTEKMLNNLQKHIEQEEINWRIKENYSIELEQKVTNLEVELKAALADKKKISLELQGLKSGTSTDSNKAQNGLH